MTPHGEARAAFVARQAAFLQRQGVAAGSAQERLAAAFDAADLDGLRARSKPSPGAFRAAFARAAGDAAIADGSLDLPGLELEQGVAEAYLGLWRGMVGMVAYAIGLAAIATLAYQVLVIFVVPQLTAILDSGGGVPPFSRLVFETGLGGALLLAMWLLAAWTLASVVTARRAILLRAWPRLFARIGLLRGVVARHRVLLQAWAAATLLDAGVAPAAALDRAREAVAAWTRSGDADDGGDDRRMLDAAATLGTLREELAHRVATELVDAPLALAARRERLALYAGIAAAALVVPMLVAMYMMIFKTAAMV